jgi:type II secretory pathway component PulF
MNAEALIALNEEIAGMARAGLPLDQGLAALASEMGKGRLQQVTAAIATDLQAGQTLPEALKRQGDRVPSFYAGLVAAGIRTGRIDEVLASLTAYARNIAQMRTIVLDAFFYPGVVLAFAGILFGFCCVFVLPQFDLIFRDFRMQLPLATELLLRFGRQPLTTVVVPLAGLLLAILTVKLCLRWTERGRRRWAQLVYAVPVAGTLIRAARLAAFADLLGMLVDHALPLPEALRLTGEASSDPLMAGASRQIEDELNQGRPLGTVLRGRGLVPEWVSWMVGLGERRGTLGKTLHQVADTYRRQVEVRAVLLRNVLPPLMIIGTAGVFVAFFVFAIMLPMHKLLEGLSK